ncbi:unnamed protein product [Prorocentrum cordatum]|uniref:Uncharacterized protein n=1 Tax=Prorocentrum cordatum TaxID=2364126 RepID=A0ABN9WVR7_9DINO|nr:unnamed protein product [Polarella glacialis]
MTPGLWDKGSPDSGWVRRHFPSFEDRDVLLSDMDKYLSTIANQVLVAGLLAGLAFSALFSVERGKFTAKAGMYEPCVVSVSMVLVTNVSALVFYLAIYITLSSAVPRWRLCRPALTWLGVSSGSARCLWAC